MTGTSLMPDYRDGDFVLVSRIPYLVRSVKVGDVVAFRDDLHGLLIKRVTEVSPDRRRAVVRGTHEESLDSRALGPIQVRAILGTVVWHIRKTRR
ncbi:MAG: hypothetical protein GF346_00570 [Candidatus Eisenbacteria bacterium]|nr:hypothetical protein [Candidatus Latescibacterota bacterium]MBD3300924.1 hypothetical protein [Candidatus Eisenbacteria bacterium]